MTEAVKLELNSLETPRAKRFSSAALVLLLAYLIIWAFTRAHFMADTNVYTQAILRHQHGGDVDYRLKTANPFWDFGHILWRPFGWLCLRLTTPGTRWIAHQNQRATVLLTLLGINFLASLGGVLLFFRLTSRVIKNEWAAVWASVGFFSADAFLNYAHSGNAYIVGLACLVAGMYFSWPDEGTGTTSVEALAGGVLFAFAVLFWLPYIFVLPAAMAGPLLLAGNEKRQLRRTVQTVAACAVVGLAVYASAIYIVGIRNVVDLKEWILAAGHGHIQAGGFRAMARLAFAVPRSFVYMGYDGMWLKRYLLHDPYAPVTLRSLFALSLWKLVLFYAAASIVSLELLSKTGRALLFVVVSAVVPIFVFAIFIFEAGSIERYLPLYPFVFLAFGYVLASKHAHSASKGLLLFALAVMVAVNVNAMRRSTLESQKAEAVARIHDLIPRLGPKSLELAVNEQDSLAQFRQNFPLDPINLNAPWQTYDVLEINTERLATWREDFAKQVFATWEGGGTVWLPVRFLRAEPKPEWNWVEGDDNRVRWTDLPAFFSKFDLGPVVGGEDGFVLLQESARNRKILEPLDQRTPSSK